MCRTMTRQQWISTRGVVFPDCVRALAEAVYAGRGVEPLVRILHDALLDANLPHLAEHFAPGESHTIRTPGPGQCWALLMILGRLPRRRELLGTPTAAEWLGITPAEFRRLARESLIVPEATHQNEHHRTGPPCPLWAPEDILAILPSAVEVIQGRRRKGTPRQAGKNSG
jgi:hypothetical protein